MEEIPKSSTNQVFVQYVRGRILQRSEFILKYEQIEHDCGGSSTLDYITKSSTIITTPNYPNIPNPHIECLWRITAPNGELLKIDFLERFDLTTTPTCSNEFLEVREGSTSNSPIIGKFCGNMPQPIFTSTNMVRLLYFTDVTVPRNGFKLNVTFARCGKSINERQGYISSPGFPGKGNFSFSIFL